jgi:hypothetical protein
VAARCGLEEPGEPSAVGFGDQDANGDATLLGGPCAGPDADEEAAVADQRDASLLEDGSVHDVMRSIKVWAEAHMDEVLTHREEYDTRHAEHDDAPG